MSYLARSAQWESLQGNGQPESKREDNIRLSAGFEFVSRHERARSAHPRAVTLCLMKKLTYGSLRLDPDSTHIGGCQMDLASLKRVRAQSFRTHQIRVDNRSGSQGRRPTGCLALEEKQRASNRFLANGAKADMGLRRAGARSTALWGC